MVTSPAACIRRNTSSNYSAPLPYLVGSVGAAATPRAAAAAAAAEASHTVTGAASRRVRLGRPVVWAVR